MNTGAEHRFLRIISGESRSPAAIAARGGLSLLEPGFRLVVAARNWAFDRKIMPSHAAGRPVVCVGNLTTGGTGKTPVVAWLANALRRELCGEIAILTRGYKGRSGNSDEATLLRQMFPGPPAVHVMVNPNRAAGARRAIELHPDLRAFVMDDGFQHRKLERDFDLVLIDSTNPFGFNHLLPRGLLREPIEALSRAHAVLLTRTSQALPSAIDSIEARIKAACGSMQIFRSSHQIAGFRQPDGKFLPIESANGKRLAIFAGIGNPSAFHRSLTQAGFEVVAHHWFADHHVYDARSIDQINAMCRDSRADVVITTEKDAVKMPDASGCIEAPMLMAQLRIQFEQEQLLLDLILKQIRKA